jgi:hypothetical protein
MCKSCLEGGNRVLERLHRYPLPSSMLVGEDVLSPCAWSWSSPLACEMRTDMLRSRRFSVLLRCRCRCTCRVEALEGGESSFAVGASERGIV